MSKKPKYSGVLATPMHLFSTRELGTRAGMSAAEVRRRNAEIMKARVQALREHYRLTKSEPNWVLIIRMGRDLGIPGCQEANLQANRRGAVESLRRMEFVAEILEIMNEGKNINEACRALAKRESKRTRGGTNLNAASLRVRYYEAVRELDDETIERLKTYFT